MRIAGWFGARISRFGWPAQTWVAIAAAAVASLALFVSVDQANQSRKHNRLSVKLYLEFKTLYLPGQDHGLYISNLGLGPAFVESEPLEPTGYAGRSAPCRAPRQEMR